MLWCLIIFAIANQKQLIAFKTSNAGREFGLDINRDGSRIITSGTPPKIWNAKNGDIIASLNGHQFPVVSAAFSPDGKGVVTASMDKTAKVWIVESATEQFTIRGHAEAVLDAVYSPDGTSVLTASADGTARVWDAKTGNASGMVLTHPKGVLKARYSRDGSKIATVAGDNLARVWNAKTGIATHTVSGFDDPDGHIRSAMFHPDGTKILLAAHRVAIVWDLDKGAESYRFEGHEESVTNALYDSEGIEVLTSSLDGSVVVWDANSKKYTVPKYSFEREKVLVSQVATSDCYSLISTSKLRHLIFEPTNAIYSSNGKYIASVGSGTGGSTVTIWERLSGAGK